MPIQVLLFYCKHSSGIASLSRDPETEARSIQPLRFFHKEEPISWFSPRLTSCRVSFPWRHFRTHQTSWSIGAFAWVFEYELNARWGKCEVVKFIGCTWSRLLWALIPGPFSLFILPQGKLYCEYFLKVILWTYTHYLSLSAIFSYATKMLCCRNITVMKDLIRCLLQNNIIKLYVQENIKNHFKINIL